MAAGLGFKTFTTGEVLTAADTNGYLMQGINVFASSAARAAAITSPQEGQYSYLKDTNALEYYDGAAWVGAPVGDITAVTAGKGLTGGGSSGDVTVSLATTAKGDLVAGSGASTATVLTVGNNGEVLMPDSSTSTGLRYQAIQTRNCVYNSSFDIWQRGTSFTANGYTADRWYAVTAGVAGRTISRVAGTGQFQYLTRIQRTAGNTATNGVDFGQSFEIADATPYAGKTVTVSFYARKGADWSVSSSNLVAYVFSGTSSTETNRVTTAYPSGGVTALAANATLTTTLQRFQYSFSFGASITQFCILFSVGFNGTAGTNDYVEITGVQLEVGSVATDYVRQTGSIQGELAACQRYYYRTTGQAAAANDLTTGYCNSTTSAVGVVRPPVTMRIAPTCAFGAAGDFVFVWSAGASTITAAQIDRSSVDSINLRLTTSGLTTGQGGYLALNTGTTKYLEMSAEL